MIATQSTTKPRYSYKETPAASQKANWRIEDIIGGDKQLSFTQPFMSESFARVEELSFLTPDEKLKLDQIRGFDLENLQSSTSCSLTGDERKEFITKQHQALRWTFLGSGMTHPNFLATLEGLSPALRRRIEQVAPVFC
jgi:hypothetical protein